jgi:type II secretory pathway pseudopilin PulG
MNKRGIALILALLVSSVLIILLGFFFLRSINENNLVRRSVNSTRAFWLAEAGVAEATRRLPTILCTTGSCSGDLDNNTNYRWSATSAWWTSAAPGVDIYQVKSTGTVILPSGGSMDRNLETFVSVTPPQPDGFDLAIEVNGLLNLHGSYDINPDDSYVTDAGLSFTDKFNLSSDRIKSIAIEQETYYVNPSSPLQNLNGVTWIDIVAPTTKLKIPKTGWSGSGILIVNGDADIEGGTFNGIIWVIGELTITGNGTINGAVLSECEETVVTDIGGNPTINYNWTTVDSALNLLDAYASRTIVSWRETP